MAQFHQHPDGLVYVRANGLIYYDTTANFARDFGQMPVLPPGVIERFYDDAKPGGWHHLFNADYNQIPGGEQPYRFGDLAIGSIDSLLASKAKRIAVVEKAAVKPPAPMATSHNPSQFPVVRP